MKTKNKTKNKRTKVSHYSYGQYEKKLVWNTLDFGYWRYHRGWVHLRGSPGLSSIKVIFKCEDSQPYQQVRRTSQNSHPKIAHSTLKITWDATPKAWRVYHRIMATTFNRFEICSALKRTYELLVVVKNEIRSPIIDVLYNNKELNHNRPIILRYPYSGHGPRIQAS